MNLEKINKEWITSNDLKEALRIPHWLAKFMLENATVVWTMKKRYQYVNETGELIIQRDKPCEHVTEKYDIVYGA